MGATGCERAGGLHGGTAGLVAASASLFGFREVSATPGNPTSVSSSLLREENVTVSNGAVGESPVRLVQNQRLPVSLSTCPSHSGTRSSPPWTSVSLWAVTTTLLTQRVLDVVLWGDIGGGVSSRVLPLRGSLSGPQAPRV